MEKTNIYYIYAWYKKENNEIFYIGKGKNDRYKKMSKRTKYFLNFYNNFDCDVKFLRKNLTEKEALFYEKELIKYYKSLNQAQANIHKGGKFGGDTFSNLPEEEKENFIQKMTTINKTRCNQKEFKENAKKRLIDKYANIEERKKQSEKIKKSWENEILRKKQSEKIKEYYKNNPNKALEKGQKQKKPCLLYINEEKLYFDSLKSLEVFMLNKYNLKISTNSKNKILNPNGHIFRKNNVKDIVFKLEYLNVETIENRLTEK